MKDLPGHRIDYILFKCNPDGTNEVIAYEESWGNPFTFKKD